MKTCFGSLYHLFWTANAMQKLWCAGLLLIMLVLAVLHHKWRGDKKKIRTWRLLSLIPLLLSIVHFMLYVFGCPFFMEYYIPFYLIAVLALIPILTANRKIGYRITAVLTGLLTVLCGAYYALSAPNYHNYIRKSYTDSFHSLVKAMDREYVLKEWKEVDFAALEATYMPLVKEAEAEAAHDPEKFANIVTQFCNQIHDGHIQVESLNTSHDLGLGLILLDHNDVIAVKTTETVNQLGIEDGTIITKWNGRPVLQAADELLGGYGQPVKRNGEIASVIRLASESGETAEVTFMDHDGKERTVTLHALPKPADPDAIITPVKVYQIFRHRSEDSEKENFSTGMLNDRCGYLILNKEETASDLKDLIGFISGNHKWAREMFREKLRDLRSQGMEELIIDLRGNRGGYAEIAMALCDLLTKDDWYGQGLGIRKGSSYTCVSDHMIHGDGEFADLKILAITNFGCASAGDTAVLYLSKLPNVTVAGITDPKGCGQETGGMCVLAGGVVVSYPTGLTLNEDGEPDIDTKPDRISRNPVEVRIPFDYDAAMKMYRDQEDYELDWAIRYLEEHW